jgi:uracil-DNA glycosylase
MRWSDHQHALLQGMGLRLWEPPDRATQGAEPVKAAAPQVATAGAQPAERVRRPDARHAPAAVPDAVTRPLVNGLNWAELRDSVAACRACTLCESRTQTVFGVGHPQAHWLVVGEAPGEQEDRAGEPFVGAAGQLLDRMLAALGLTRQADGPAPPEQRVYIANTLKCRPPRNRNPTPEELAQCEPFLQRQIELLQPRIILAMGRFAVQMLMRSDQPIGRLRGQVHRYQGVPLVVTYHPAYLLRSLPEKAKSWLDLCLAADVADGLHTPGLAA